MSYPFPPVLNQLVREELATGAYRSEDDVLVEAMRALRDRDETIAGIREGLSDFDAGRVRSLSRAAMRPIKAVYEDGHLMFPDGAAPEGRMEVVIVFPDQSKLSPPRDKDAGKRFVKEWSGVLKGVDIEGWKEQRIADLEEKHR